MGDVADWFDNLSITDALDKKRGQDGKDLLKAFESQCLNVKGKLKIFDTYLDVIDTPQDFDRHISTLIKNGSCLLTHSLDCFTTQELIAFLYACLFHSIEMVYNPFGRKKNSKEDTEKVYSLFTNIFNNNDIKTKFSNHSDKLYKMHEQVKIDPDMLQSMYRRLLADLSDVTGSFVTDTKCRKTIAHILWGHRNIIINDNNEIDTLDLAYYNNIQEEPQNNHIRCRCLALSAILRLANVLDCSQSRINGIEGRMTPGKNPDWDKLRIIRSVSFDHLPTISLTVDSDFIQEQEDKAYWFQLLREIIAKIEKERDIFLKCNISNDFSNLSIAEIILDFNHNDNLKDTYNTYCENHPFENTSHDKATDVNEVKAEIDKYIKDKHLICNGHYYTGKTCYRNHLDCNSLLSNQNILDQVSRIMLNNIATGCFDKSIDEIKDCDHFLVGVANSGILISSYISTLAKIPMVYYIPSYKDRMVSDQVKDWHTAIERIKNKKAILIIGSTITGSAIEEAYKSIKEEFCKEENNNQIEAVLGIFNRNKDNNLNDRLKDPDIRINFLTDDYPADFCKYENEKDCPYHKLCKEDEEE